MADQQGKTTHAFGLRTLLPVLMVAALVLAANAADDPVLNFLHVFTGYPDGGYVRAGLTADAAGNFYGTTSGGGHDGCGGAGCGTVFKLVHRGTSWIETPIYVFAGFDDGGLPMGRVIFGPDGSLYGTTAAGGTGTCRFGGTRGCGTVFKLQPPPTFCRSALCLWTKTTLYSFAGGTDGANPYAEVAFDRDRNLYSTTLQGGNQQVCEGGCGTVFKLTRNPDGRWSEAVIYAFQGGATDGTAPYSEVVLDGAENLYGTTALGGQGCPGVGCGIVYKLAPSGSGWTESVIHFFTGGSEGANPYGGLLLDIYSDLYGATAGPGVAGGVYQLDPGIDGYAFRMLHNFRTNEASNASSRLTMDGAGNFFGTAQQGGAYGSGTVYQLANFNGVWTYIRMHDFDLAGGDAGTPYAPVVFIGNNMYGTTAAGPEGNGLGVVFEIPR